MIAPAGEVLTPQYLASIATTMRHGYKPISLLNYGTIREDLSTYLKQEPYRLIFDSPETVVRVFRLMENIELVPPILKFLDYFRKKDLYTYRHSLVVSVLTTIIANDLFRDPSDAVLEATVGPTHDFGKISVPLHILKKSTPLTRTEREELEHHTLAGLVLLSYYFNNPNKLACKVAYEHHERRDGSGYPRAIELSDKMVEIVAVADVYDALVSPRPYRKVPYDNRTALEEITEMGMQGKLSLDLVRILISHNRKDKPFYKECIVSSEKRGTPPPESYYGTFEDDHQ